MGTDINFRKHLNRTYGTYIGLPAFDPAAAAYFTATGITEATQQQAINNLVKGLKSDGLWSKMKAVYPFVTDNRNLLGYTEDFSNAFWIKNNATVTANSINSPNGTLTADTINYTASGSVYYSTTVSGIYTFSVYLKYKGSQWACIENYNAPTDKAAWFDIQNGVLGTTSNAVSSSIESVGNSWFRCSVTTNASNSFPSLFAFFTTSTNGGFTRNSDLYSWGAQLELGSTATTYQPIATTQQAFIASQFKYNLVNPVDSDAAFRLVFNGGWTHSANGATPNGTNGYADTKLNPFVVFGTGYASHGSYYRETFTALQTNIDGCTITSRFDMGYDTGVLAPFMAIGSNASNTSADTDNRGLVLSTRQGATSVKMFRNNVLKVNGNQTFASNPNLNYYVAGRNFAGTAQLFSNSKSIAFKFIADSLTDTDVSNLTNKVQAFQTALSRQV